MPRTKKRPRSPVIEKCDEVDTLLSEASYTLQLAQRTLTEARAALKDVEDRDNVLAIRQALEGLASAEEFFGVAKAHYDDVLDVAVESSGRDTYWALLSSEVPVTHE